MANTDYCFLHTEVDGSLVISYPQDCGMTLEEIKTKDLPSDRPIYTIKKTELPTDFSFEGAWTYTE